MDELLDIEYIKKLSYKDIKALVDNIPLKDNIHNDKIMSIINNLKNDKRKNVISLGERLLKNIEKINKEIERVKKLYNFDKAFKGYNIVAGVDEVGRGPLAGPIVACAVILDLNVIDNDLLLGINDSKKLTEHKREENAFFFNRVL